MARQKPRHRAKADVLLKLAQDRGKAKGRAVWLAIGTMNETARKPGCGVAFQMIHQRPNGPRRGEGIGIQEIDVIRPCPIGQARADAKIVARPKAAIVPRLQHAHLMRARVPTLRRHLCRQHLKRPIARVIVDHHHRAVDPLQRRQGRLHRAQRHRGRAPVQDHGQHTRHGLLRRRGEGHDIALVPLNPRNHRLQLGRHDPHIRL